MPMTDSVTVRLPRVSPALYLEWVAYWREVERRMLEHPALADHAARESAPFLRDPIADWISDTVVGAIVSQAGEARRAGLDTVAPELGGDVLVMREWIRYMARRAEWLDRPGVHRAMGVEPPIPAVVELRESVGQAVYTQLALHVVEPVIELEPEPAPDEEALPRSA
jgi:hypothetical protein